MMRRDRGNSVREIMREDSAKIEEEEIKERQ